MFCVDWFGLCGLVLCGDVGWNGDGGVVVGELVDWYVWCGCDVLCGIGEFCWYGVV